MDYFETLVAGLKKEAENGDLERNPYAKELHELILKGNLSGLPETIRERFTTEDDHKAENRYMLLSALYRGHLAKKYSYAIPTVPALQLIAKYSPIIEIGSGNGYWAAQLAALNCDILAFDSHPRTECWTTVHTIQKGTISQHSDRSLFLCWPLEFAAEALHAYIKAGGQRLICIGEGVDGNCASAEFFQILAKELEHVESQPLLQWYGMHDRLTVWQRR